MEDPRKIVEALGLEPLPGEGGFFRRTYESAVKVADGRPAVSAIYYLILPHDFSALHRVRSEELFHFYAGDPVEMIQISPEGVLSRHLLGSGILQDQRPQVLVPAHHWQGARLRDGGSWALLGATVCLSYLQKEFELGKREELEIRYPELQKEIFHYTRGSHQR